MNKKIIALIVTAGNRDISKTISSIESQTKKVDEIIIASEKDFASEYKVLVNPYKKGLARNTNQSLVRIKDLYPNENLYIATVDDDDLWKETYIEKAFNLIQKGNNFVTCWMEVKDNNEIIDEYKFTLKDMKVKNFIIGNIGVQGSNKVFNLDMCLESGMMSKHINSSTDRVLNIALLSHPEVKVAVIEESLVIYQKDSYRERISNDKHRLNDLRNFYMHFDGYVDVNDVEKINDRHDKLHNIPGVITWK